MSCQMDKTNYDRIVRDEVQFLHRAYLGLVNYSYDYADIGLISFMNLHL